MLKNSSRKFSQKLRYFLFFYKFIEILCLNLKQKSWILHQCVIHDSFCPDLDSLAQNHF